MHQKLSGANWFLSGHIQIVALQAKKSVSNIHLYPAVQA